MAIATDPGNLDPHLTLLGAARTVGSFTYDTLVNVVGPGSSGTGTWRGRGGSRSREARRVHAPSGHHVLRRQRDDGNRGQAEPRLRRQPGEQVAATSGSASPSARPSTANNGTGTVVVYDQSPNPFMIQGLGLVQMVCSRGLENRSLLDRGALGSGPYRLVESVSGDHYTFQVRNGYRWGPNGATTAAQRLPARVILRVVPNETTAANLLLTGGPQRRDDPRRRARPAQRAGTTSGGSTIAFPTELFFNQKQGQPGADATVRRAIVQAMNLRQFGTVVTSGRGVRGDAAHEAGRHAVPRQHRRGHVPAYNPGAARSVLNGRGTRLRLIYPTDAGIATINSAMELVQQQLSAAGRQRHPGRDEHRSAPGRDLRHGRLGRRS